jgi:hypothetical protein
MTWFFTIQKIIIYLLALLLVLHEGLEFVSSIYMRLSFGEVVKYWVEIVGGKLLCVVDVGSRHLSY